jgi:3-oxoacyl-[acyl-carrier protein] reductase
VKRALVTGGTRGIGLAVCRELFKRGYVVTALYSSNEEDAKAARKALPSAAFLRVDVSDEEAIKKVVSDMGSIDVLVNNAGVSLIKQVQDTSLAEWNSLFAVNVGGVFLCCKHVAKKMISAQRGAIVNISSVWGEVGASCESAYSASKGAVIAFTKALSKELAPSHITVNCITPGVIDTRMNGCFSSEEKAAIIEEIPLGRMGTAEEVARAVCDLAENDYITGQVLGVNGGY